MSLAPLEGERVPLRRGGVPGPLGGGAYLSRVQYTRMLDAALGVVADEGVKGISATRVSARAGMSTKTFYDLFANREDCFLAVFDRVVEELGAAVGPVWEAGSAGDVEGEWVERVRSALTVLLGALEREPALGKVVFLEALGAGPRVLVRRAEVLDRVAGFIDEGRVGSPLAGVLPSLTAAGVVGAAFSVIHSRLAQELQEPGPSLMGLVGPVMATVVLPYRGREVSARELERPVPELPELPEFPEPAVSPGDAGEDRAVDVPPLDLAELRPTRRTFMVLAAVAGRGGGSNRVVGEAAGILDPAQISKMLARLREYGLVENRGGRTAGVAKAWWLTGRGEEFLRAGVEGTPGLRSVRPLGRGRGVRELQRGGTLVRRTRGDTAARRTRILRAAVVEADEHGYASLTVGHIAARARVSRRTFYEMFGDREACLFAVMVDIDAQVTAELQAAGLDGLPWRERMREGLWAVLRFFDRELVLARFCFVESARGDGRIASYREGLLARVAGAIAAGAEQHAAGEVSSLTAEGLAGAVVSILSTRLAHTGWRATGTPGNDGTPREDTPAGGLLRDLLGELMGLIVLPYLGPVIAGEERARPAPIDPVPAPLPAPEPGGKAGGRYLASDAGRPGVSSLRVTYRTALVLEAIAREPGVSNLQVARLAQINDQGQVSKLLSRLERHGLAQNTGRGQARGAPNEWRLTPAGQKVEQSIRGRAGNHGKQAA